MEYAELLFPPQNPLQNYALVFLAGSLTVSSLSDLKRMAAQADFAEVWAAFVAAMFLADLYSGLTGQTATAQFLAKWLLVAAYAVLVTATRFAAISTMDVAAEAALLSALGPAYILAALVLTFIVNELLQPVLRRYGEAGAYPFLPTVLAVNVIMLAVIGAGGFEPYLGLGAAAAI